MLLTQKEEDAKKALFWATQSREPARHYEHKEIGYNYRLSNISAGIGRGQLKVLNAFQKNQAADFHLNGSTGYGYGDIGRDVLELIWADVFQAEKALVRANIASGTHALAICLYGNLLPGDQFVSISGTPYDTLLKIIGKNKETGTLSELGIKHDVVELVDDDFNYEEIAKVVTPATKMVCIQRSRGYNWRKSLTSSEPRWPKTEKNGTLTSGNTAGVSGRKRKTPLPALRTPESGLEKNPPTFYLCERKKSICLKFMLPSLAPICWRLHSCW